MKKSLSLILFLSLTLSLHAQVTSGLVAYYPFTGNTQDASGNDYHGTISGGVTLAEDMNGNPSSAYNFNGTSGRIDIMSEIPASLLGNNSKSISLWIYPTKSRNAMVYMGTTATTGGGTLRFITDNNGNLGVDISAGISYSTIQIEVNQWNFVFLTWDGTNFTVGKGEGELLQTEQITDLTHHNLLQGTATIGYELLNGFYAGGNLDEVRIYDRVLGENDLLELYTQTSPPDPLVYFPFSGNTNDESGNNYHGTITGTVSPVSDCSGTSASAYEFSNNGYITFFDSDPNGIPETILGTNTKSVVLRFYPTQLANSLFTLGGSSLATGGSFRFVTNTSGMLGVDISNGLQYSNIGIDLNEWNLLYLCWDGTNFTITKQSESNPTIAADTIKTLNYHNLQQGLGYVGYDPYRETYANGIIDEVQLYDKCLSEEERPEFTCPTLTGNTKSVSDIIKVAPNPSSGKFEVIMNGSNENVGLTIVNSTGNIVYSEKTTSIIGKKEIQLSAEPGIYFLLIKSGSKVQTEKIIVE